MRKDKTYNENEKRSLWAVIISVIYVSVSANLFFLAKDHIFMFSHISGNLFTRVWILCHVVECLIFCFPLKSAELYSWRQLI